MLENVERRVKAGVAHGEANDGPLTVGRYVKHWIEERRKRGLACVDDDEGRLKHAIPTLGPLLLRDVRPRHTRELVRALRRKCGPERDQLAPRTVRHIYATLHTMGADAVADELIENNPFIVKRGELPRKIDKDPTWRATAVFAKPEVEAIISDERIPLDRRVMYALEFIGGVRFGESAELRMRDYDPTARPLGRLNVSRSYDTHTHEVKPVKGTQPRLVPVHPTLARIIADWKLHGWPIMFGRAPTPDDLLIPSRDPSREGRQRNANTMLRRFHKDCQRIGLRPRRQHDMRRTFISLAIGDGARRDVLEWVTHAPRGDIMNLYTTLPWEVLCEEVAKLRIGFNEGKVVPLPLAVGASSGDASYSPSYNPPKTAKLRRGSGGADGTRTRGLRRDRPAL